MERPVLVSWLGGEPLLWPILSQASEIVKSCGLSLAITTNGIELSDLIKRRLLLEQYNEVTISLDIEKGTHDTFRGKNCFDLVFSNISTLVKERNKNQSSLKIRVNSILMADNVRYLSTFIESLNSIGVDEVTFNELGGIERPEFWLAHRLKNHHLEIIKSELKKSQAFDIKVKLPPTYFSRMLATANETKLSVKNCMACTDFLFIHENGKISPCTFTNDYSGYLNTDITSSENLQMIQKNFQAMNTKLIVDGPCSDCKSTFNFGKFNADQ